jgi:serine/threonine protein kinase
MPLHDSFKSDPYKRNPLQKRANDAILENMNLATPPSRKDLSFVAARALELAPATQVLQWRSTNGTPYQLQLTYHGDVPTWVLLNVDEEPHKTVWRVVTENPEQIYRLLLKKAGSVPDLQEPGSPGYAATGDHPVYIPANEPLTLATPIVSGSIFLDRYQVMEQIARGGMGIVYRAVDMVMNRDVAVKVLHAHLIEDNNAKQRFEKEMQACISFKHPNVVSVFDYGYSPGHVPYMVMEYLDGLTLEQQLEKIGTMDVLAFVSTFTQICSALTHSHEKGIVHRDVKPRNVILVKQGEADFLAKLVDFGIAKSVGSNTLQRLTLTGDAIGSPFYMSPEQCKSEVLDARSDIYSLGCMMYQAISGMLPFNGQNPLTTIFMHVNDRAAPFTNLRPDLDIPAELERIVLKTLEKNPDDRHQTAKELSDELQGIKKSRGPLQPHSIRMAMSSIRSNVVVPTNVPTPDLQKLTPRANPVAASSPGVAQESTQAQNRQVLPAFIEPPAVQAPSPRQNAEAAAYVPIVSPPTTEDFTDSADNIDSILGEIAAAPQTPINEQAPPPVVLELLKQAGIISFEDAEAALKLQSFHGGDPGRFLVELGCIDNRTFLSASQAENLMARFSLNVEDAALTLKYCYKKGITIEEALAELE